MKGVESLMFKFLQDLEGAQVLKSLLPNPEHKDAAFARMVVKAALPRNVSPAVMKNLRCVYVENNWPINLDSNHSYKGCKYSSYHIKDCYYVQVINHNPITLAVSECEPLVLLNGYSVFDAGIIYSNRPHIEAATGKVLTYGLKAGYYAYMAHIKPDVESVTVVEKDQRVVHLFKKHLLPKFPNPEKISIVEDADPEAFDYIFVNDYLTVEEGIERYRNPIKGAAYWAEELLRSQGVTNNEP